METALSPGAPNYWAQAWHARRYVDQRAGRVLGRDELSLAINSVYGRSQDQLHIHIECIKPAVRAALPGIKNGDTPDLQTQVETLLDQVWRCEAEWRFDDLLDLATRLRR